MKVFSRILGTIVLFFVAFFLIGVFVPSVSYDFEVEINRPTNEVFQALTDSEMLPQWISGLQTLELVDGKTGNSGAVYTMTVNDGAQSVEFEETILRFEPDSVLAYSLESKSVSGSVTVKCRERTANTALFVHTELKGNVWFTRSFLPLFKKSLIDRNTEDYRSLKSLLESK